MSSVRFEPIAIQLSKVVALDRLLPADALERARREQAEAGAKPALEPDIEQFLLHYMALARAAFQLLGAPHFERLSSSYDRIVAEFMPGGPPASPVYDSYVTQHLLAEVPQGLAGETPYSVLARLTKADRARERLHQLAQALADSHHDLYRVLQVTGLRAQLQRVRDPSALSVGLTGPFVRTGDRLLARVLRFGEAHFIADSPYLLRAPEPEWLEYLERSGAPPEANGSGAATAAHESPAPPAQLTPKQRARLRQRQKLAQREPSSEAAVTRHLKYGRSERYWLDFIVAGYAGERGGIVYLAGIPDRPETLPHHDDYEPPSPADPAAT